MPHWAAILTALLPQGLFDTGGIVHITQALMEAGFSVDEIRAVMGGNALRVIKQGLIPFKDLPKQAVEQAAESSQ